MTTNAIVPVNDTRALADWKTLVKATLAKASNPNDTELMMFAQVSNHLGLDVWRRELYMIRYGQNNPVSFVIGIDGFLRKAAETGLYDGQDPILYAGKDGEWTELWVSDDPPYAAKATVYRKGSSHGITYIARYNSARRDSPLWKSQPDIQLGINALKHALRRGFGDAFGDLDQQVIRLRSEGMRVVDEDTGEILDALPDPTPLTNEERKEAFQAAAEDGASESYDARQRLDAAAETAPQQKPKSNGKTAATRFWSIANKHGSVWWEPLLQENFSSTSFEALDADEQTRAAELVEAEDANG